MILNKRDLGGLNAAGGKKIKDRMLIRSGDLAKAEPSELDGISCVIDLRTPAEAQEEPDISYGAEYHSAPLFTEATPGVSHENESDTPEVPDLKELYALLIRNCKEQLKVILGIVISHDYSTGAVLWHCTEGKDRSGIVTALVLDALGVSREDIMTDYLKTNLVNVPKAEAYREKLKEVYGEEFAEKVYRVMTADAGYLEAAWKETGEDYLEKELGISEGSIELFRKKVLA
ncbi:MAG: tyrosine-protein phosphatase [Clostridia bacterium]|nr:tyrosine-protein phosphatase [Clostridia bacterium]